MKHLISHEVCNSCYEKGNSLTEARRQFHSLESTPGNKVVWYECGHVLIIQDDTVVVQHNFAS